MKSITKLKLIAAALAAMTLAGCIVVPVGPGYGHRHHHVYRY